MEGGGICIWPSRPKGQMCIWCGHREVLWRRYTARSFSPLSSHKLIPLSVLVSFFVLELPFQCSVGWRTVWSGMEWSSPANVVVCNKRWWLRHNPLKRVRCVLNINMNFWFIAKSFSVAVTLKMTDFVCSSINMNAMLCRDFLESSFFHLLLLTSVLSRRRHTCFFLQRKLIKQKSKRRKILKRYWI